MPGAEDEGKTPKRCLRQRKRGVFEDMSQYFDHRAKYWLT